MEEKKKNSNKLPILIIVVLIVAVAGLMTYRQMHTSEKTTCNVVPQSAFGQGQAQSWVQMKSAETAAIGAGFELDYPIDKINVDYDSTQYWSYTQQIDEHRYFQGDKEVFRIAKGKMCGQPVYTPDNAFTSTVIAKVNGNDVTEYGDGTTVTAVSWTSGAYSYFIGAFGKPMEKQEIEDFVSEVN